MTWLSDARETTLNDGSPALTIAGIPMRTATSLDLLYLYRSPAPLRRQLPLLHLLGICLAVAAMGLMASPDSQAATKKTRATSTKKSNAVKIKSTRNDSSETPAERDKRLFRECQGLPNAGVCLGYNRR